MDLDTENRLAALLMEEARRLRVQADKEGVHAYLNRKFRARPNSRFLTATVLGVQQANRAVEVDEMWRAREKEIELENRWAHRSKDEVRGSSERHNEGISKGSHRRKHKTAKYNLNLHPSDVQQKGDFCSIDDDGLRDEDIEKFLNSRAKRGRGAVGSRMDETGPYPTCGPSNQEENKLASSEVRVQEDWERKVLGPERPPSFRSYESAEAITCETEKSAKRESRSKKRQWSDHSLKEDKKRKKRREERKAGHCSRNL